MLEFRFVRLVLNMFKKFVILVVMASSVLSLGGCATTNYVGDGIVMQSTPLHHFDLKPGAHTKKGAIQGLTYGGIGGVLIGTGVGLVIAAADVPTLGGFLVGGIVGAAAGAAYYGILGGIIGTSTGYISDVSHKNFPHYEMKVQSIPYAKVLTITQYSTQIPLNTRVRIFEKNGQFFVRKSASYHTSAVHWKMHAQKH